MGQCVKVECTPFQKKGGGMKRKRYSYKLKGMVAVLSQ